MKMDMKMKKLDDESWEVLSWVYFDIKHKAFFNPGKVLVYTQPDRLFSHKPTPHDAVKGAIYTLQDKGVIEVIDEEDFGPKSGAPIKWKIKILPKFKKFANELFKTDNSNILGSNILTWGVINLNIKSGRAKANNKSHLFKIEEPPFKIFKELLQKRVFEQDDGKVNFDEFTQVTGIKDKEIIKLKIRELRRGLGISRKVNPLQDIFQETGNGYKLIQPESFSKPTPNPL